MKVLVTGATGFIGKHLTKRLIEEGLEVVCTGRTLSRLSPFLERVKAVYLDIKDGEAVRRILRQERPQALFHCAALVRNLLSAGLKAANVEGTRNILEACLEEGVESVVYLSSIAVISGNTQVPLTENLPYLATNSYGQSKIEAEKIALSYRQRGLKIAILRPPIVYGEDEPHGLPLLVKLIRHRLFPILGDGNNRFHLVGIDNLIDAMMLCLKNEQAYHGTYIVADKEILTIKEIFEYIAKMLQVKPPLHIPQGFIPFFTHLPLLGRSFSHLVKERVYGIKRLQEDLGYTPRVSVYEGLKKAVLSRPLS